jgi:hypothetical protein
LSWKQGYLRVYFSKKLYINSAKKTSPKKKAKLLEFTIEKHIGFLSQFFNGNK